MVFFTNPPYTNASSYSTLAEIYNIRNAFIESEKRHAEQMARVLRELKKLRPGVSRAVDESLTSPEKNVQDSVCRCEAKVNSIKEAVSDIAQQLATLVSMIASEQQDKGSAACGNERRMSDVSDGSIELLHTPDCVRPL